MLDLYPLWIGNVFTVPREPGTGTDRVIQELSVSLNVTEIDVNMNDPVLAVEIAVPEFVIQVEDSDSTSKQGITINVDNTTNTIEGRI